MTPEVTQHFQTLPEWQATVGDSIRKMIYETIPSVTERMQYGKPHYLKNGHYAAVVHAAKDKVSFMIFNACELPEIKGFLKSMSSPDRKTVTITEGQNVDYKLLSSLLKQASDSL